MMDADQHAAQIKATSENCQATIQKKRSLLGRTIIWSLIAVALAVPPLEAAPPVKESKKSKPTPSKSSVPDKGLSKEFEQVLVLSPNQFKCELMGFTGILTREIIRQAILISGREGLGLLTRDASLRGEVRLVKKPECFPLELKSQITLARHVTIELSRPFIDQPAVHWESDQMTLPREFALESLVEQAEALSRTGFVEALKSAGYAGDAPRWQEKSTIPEQTLQRLNEWNLVSQYHVLQETHAAIRKEGESPERLAILVRAYSHLGSLTDSLWSPDHKVFTARALLYAERLTVRTEDAPWAVAHRAYARLFAGRLHIALADLEASRSAYKKSMGKTRPLPVWTDVVDAYCSYNPDILEQATEKDETKHLAVYLRWLLSDPVQNEMHMLSCTEELLKLEPGCCRAVDRLIEVRSLGIKRMATEQRMDQLWPVLYERLQQCNLSPKVEAPLQGYLDDPDDLISERDTRMKVVEALLKDQSTDSDLSFNALGSLLQDVNFSHVCRKLEVLTGSLSMQADDVLPDYLALVEGHPYEQYIASFTSNQPKAKAAYENLLKSYNPREVEFVSLGLISYSFSRSGRNTYFQLFNDASRNLDPVFRDQILHADRYKGSKTRSNWVRYRAIAKTLLKISPHMPQTVAINLSTNKEYAEKHAEELQKKYGQNPRVLSALADRYLAEHNDAKAVEVLKRRIEVSPDHRSYTSLAKLYDNRGEKEKWKETLESALELPSFGLENAQINNKLAHFYMDQGDWRQAKPLAENAARSYSAWGLLCAAKCYEGLGDLEGAEQLRRACSMRYATSAASWYFWCVRTDHGDVDAARQVAETHLLANPETTNLAQLMERGILQLSRGQKTDAFDSFLKAFQKHKNAYCGMHAALIADELGHAEQRDDLLNQIADLWEQDYGSAELANVFQQMLQMPDQADWNPNWFQSLLIQLGEGNPTNRYYFAAKFLEQRGQQKWVDSYLQSAATSSDINKYNCMLAAQELRSKDQKVKARRISELDDGYAEPKQLLVKAARLLQAEKWKEAIQLFDEILKLKPDLTIAYLNRGQIHVDLKDDAAAITDYKKTLEIDPDFWLAHNNLALVYATSEFEEWRDADLALKHAQQAFDLLPTKLWLNYDTLAAAYAAKGDFKKAIELENQILKRWPDSHTPEAKHRISLFKEGKPYQRTPEAKKKR